MGTQRTHGAISTDGVTLGATVHGQGPSLVFWHGPMAMATSTGRRWYRI
jgi:hypothetical protein